MTIAPESLNCVVGRYPMVIYNLSCKKNHQFEGWFPSSEGFEEQVKLKQISCPVCSSTVVHKLPHACAIHTNKKEGGKKRRQSSRAPSQSISESDAKELFLRLNHYVRDNFEDVGPHFAEEARKIFNGESEKRSVYGTANSSEREELDAEGVPYMSLPKPELDS